MKCPHCTRSGKFLVLESRALHADVYRRRLCSSCGKTFVTHETAPPGLKMPAELRNSYARRGEAPPSARKPTGTSDGAHLQGVWK